MSDTRTRQRPFLKRQGCCSDFELLADTFGAAIFLLCEMQQETAAIIEADEFAGEHQRVWVAWSIDLRGLIAERLPTTRQALDDFLSKASRLLDIIHGMEADKSFSGLRSARYTIAPDGSELGEELKQLQEYFDSGSPGQLINELLPSFNNCLESAVQLQNKKPEHLDEQVLRRRVMPTGRRRDFRWLLEMSQLSFWNVEGTLRGLNSLVLSQSSRFNMAVWCDD